MGGRLAGPIKAIPLFLKVYLGLTALVGAYLFLPFASVVLELVTFAHFWIVIALWPYLTIILPAYFLKLRGVTLVIYGPVALAGIAGMVELPSVYAEHAASKLEAKLRSEDFVKPVEGAIKNISFLRRFNDRDRRNIEYMERRVACDPLCQRLLMLGHVKRVSISGYFSEKKPPDGEVPDPSFVFRYALEDRAGGCPRFDGEPDGGLVVLEMTKRAVLEGTCIVGKLIEQSPDGIVVRSRTHPNGTTNGFFIHSEGIETISAFRKDSDTIEQILLREWHTIDVATAPAIFGVDIKVRVDNFLRRFGLLDPEAELPPHRYGQIGLLTRTHHVNEHVLIDYIVNDLGVDIIPGRSVSDFRRDNIDRYLWDRDDGVVVPGTEELLSLIEKQGEGEFSEATLELIAAWVEDRIAKGSPLTDDELRVVSALSDHPHYYDLAIVALLICALPDINELMDVREDFIPRSEWCEDPWIKLALDGTLRNEAGWRFRP